MPKDPAFDIRGYIISEFNLEPTEITKEDPNNPEFSFVFKFGKHKYQIDMIDCSVNGIVMPHFYYSFGGQNIVSSILSKFNLHLGSQGFFVRKNVGGVDKVYILSKDPVAICVFLNLDYYKWVNFKTIQDIIDWIKSIRIGSVSLFRPDIFRKFLDGSKLNSQQEKMMKRPVFNTFIKSLETAAAEHDPYEDLSDVALEYFGMTTQFQKDVDDDREKKQLAMAIKGKYNLGMLKQFGLKGADLPKFDTAFKKSIGLAAECDFQDWVLKTDAAEIIAKIAEVVQTFSK